MSPSWVNPQLGGILNIRKTMTNLEIYVFILCFIVFVLLTAMFSYFIVSIFKMELELIACGRRDESIKKKLNKAQNTDSKKYQIQLWVNRIFSLLLCLIFIAAFSFAMFIQATEDRAANGIPSIKVVKSESMSEKYSGNEYLFENDLNDQFQMFDIVICTHMPDEFDLELYDIVIYKQNDTYVIHRIVGIEEPNEDHPNERYFLLQGDAVENVDTFPVLYEQMQGIYGGIRIPFLGSFVLFLQSPAGWLCILLVAFSIVVTPIVENKLKKATEKRASTFKENEM